MSHTHGIGQAQPGNQVYESRNVAAANVVSQTGTVDQASQATSVSPSVGNGDDQAKLSTSGSSIAPSADGDVRLDKIAALQSQIAAGTYNVSSSDVADKVIGALLK